MLKILLLIEVITSFASFKNKMGKKIGEKNERKNFSLVIALHYNFNLYALKKMMLAINSISHDDRWSKARFYMQRI